MAFCSFFWSLFDFLIWINFFNHIIFQRIHTLIWVPSSFCVLHFFYALAKRKKDLIYYVFGFITLFFVILAGFTDKILDGYMSAYSAENPT